MPNPTSLSDIDLSPLPGKHYFSTEREWREEFIYFLMVDRFHDDQLRVPALQVGRSVGITTPGVFYGGKIKGIKDHLDYIAGLGCTAIWLSPVFENNLNSYHGYDINNYLNIDPNFGTLQDLVDLVDAAHAYQIAGQPWPIRVILDVVINHSGDNWLIPMTMPITITTISSFRSGSGGVQTGPFPRNCEIRPGITAAAKSEITTLIRRWSREISPP